MIQSAKGGQSNTRMKAIQAASRESIRSQNQVRFKKERDDSREDRFSKSPKDSKFE
jgi:hypothetical protein